MILTKLYIYILIYIIVIPFFDIIFDINNFKNISVKTGILFAIVDIAL